MQSFIIDESAVLTLSKQKVSHSKKVKKIAKGLIKAQRADKENYGPAIIKKQKSSILLARSDNREPFMQI